ncbi:hypothetical protein T06_1603 [Trichinella sp. T6]|nr:hypothetical protein T06_1603 [Trichinella sp. T6]
MQAPRGASYRVFSYFLHRWYSPKTPFKISFPDQEDFQLLTFSNARYDLRIVFHPHSNVNLENRIIRATRMISSAGYECCFNDFEAGCPT